MYNVCIFRSNQKSEKIYMYIILIKRCKYSNNDYLLYIFKDVLYQDKHETPVSVVSSEVKQCLH
jgi:hypothetical protein